MSGKNFGRIGACPTSDDEDFFRGREEKVGAVEKKFRRERKKINSGNRKNAGGRVRPERGGEGGVALLYIGVETLWRIKRGFCASICFGMQYFS